MKRTNGALSRIGTLAAAGVLLASGRLSMAYQRDLIVEVDGRRVSISAPHQSYLERGVWMIPALPVLKAAGVWTEWDSRRGELEIRTPYGRMFVSVDSISVRHFNGRRESLSRRMAVHHRAPYLPADFLEEALRRPARYQRTPHVMSFGSPSSGRDRWDNRRDNRWDDRRDDRRDDRWGDRRDERWDDGRGDRQPGRPGDRDDRAWLRVDFPNRTGLRGDVSIGGDSRGSSVRVQVYREDGSVAVNRTAGVSNGRWNVRLSLRPGTFRVVVEALDGREVRAREESRFTVGR